MLYGPEIQFLQVSAPKHILGTLDITTNPLAEGYLSTTSNGRKILGDFQAGRHLKVLVPTSVAVPNSGGVMYSSPAFMGRLQCVANIPKPIEGNSENHGWSDVGLKGLPSGGMWERLRPLGIDPTGFFGIRDSEKTTNVSNYYLKECNGDAGLVLGTYSFKDFYEFLFWYKRLINENTGWQYWQHLTNESCKVHENGDEHGVQIRLGYNQLTRLIPASETFKYTGLDVFERMDEKRYSRIYMGLIRKHIPARLLNSHKSDKVLVLRGLYEKVQTSLISLLSNYQTNNSIPARDLGLGMYLYDFENIEERIRQVRLESLPESVSTDLQSALLFYAKLLMLDHKDLDFIERPSHYLLKKSGY